VTARRAGTITLTATTANGKSHSINVVVTTDEVPVITEPPVVVSVRIDQGNVQLARGESVQLSATVTGSDSSGIASWRVSNTAIATIDATGLLTGRVAGMATVTVTTDCGKSHSITIRVN
jgi:alpha-amylase